MSDLETVQLHVATRQLLPQEYARGESITIPAGLTGEERTKAIVDAVKAGIVGGTIECLGNEGHNGEVVDIAEILPDGKDVTRLNDPFDIESPQDLWWLSEQERKLIEALRAHPGALHIVQDAAQAHVDELDLDAAEAPKADRENILADAKKIAGALAALSGAKGRQEPPMVVIEVDGGNVQNVYSNQNVHYLVVDWDNLRDRDPSKAPNGEWLDDIGHYQPASDGLAKIKAELDDFIADWEAVEKRDAGQ